ncbi:MAG TPA: Scr1 family TA system antitoxin-like transcriptional regulator, partial [Mycobacteriales bacterium]|nr:Scr1 family TA system antitoxin-like transcriptional regulator [Mycobacteriales bacterium]
MNGSSPTVQRRRLGYLLRQFRTGLELTNRKVGAELERSESWVSRIETGESGIRLGELRALMDVYQITDQAVRTEMEALARGGRQRGWWSQYRSSLSNNYAAYIGFEASATRLLVYETLVVHGLLQTEQYARAVFRARVPAVRSDTVDHLVQVRMTRQ